MDWLSWNLVCCIRVSGSIVVYSNDDWFDLDPIYIKIKCGSHMLLYRKKWKFVIFWKLLLPVNLNLYLQSTKWVNEATWLSKIKVTSLPLTLAQNLTFFFNLVHGPTYKTNDLASICGTHFLISQLTIREVLKHFWLSSAFFSCDEKQLDWTGSQNYRPGSYFGLSPDNVIK